MSTQVKFAAVVSGLVVAAGAAWLLFAQQAVPAPVAHAPKAVLPSAPAPVTAAGGARPCVFERGAAPAWSVSLDSQTHQQVPSADVPADLAMVLSGRLSTEVVEVREQSAVLVARLKLESKGRAGIDPKTIAAPFLVEIDHQCQLVAFAREHETPRAAARNQQALLWEAQFSRHPSEAFTLADTTGVALATLEKLGETQLRRTLQGYQSRWDQLPAVETSLRGVMTVELGTGPWLEKLASRTTQSTRDGYTTSSLELTVLPQGEASFSAVERDQSRYIWENLLPQARHPDLITRTFTSFDRKRQAKVASLTIDQAMGEFADRVNRRVGVQSTWPELAAYFEVHPDAVRPALKKYLAGGLPADASGDFFLALGKARTPEARDALLELKRDDAAVPMDQVRAMFGLVLREDVGVDLAHELAGDAHRHIAARSPASDFMAGESMLALSTMSGSRDDARLGEVASQALTSVLQSEPPDSNPTRLALHAIGNTGDARLLPSVRPYLTSADVETRKAAAHAFSRMPASDADPLEIEWLQRETNPFVRKAAYLVFQQQHFNPGQGATRPLVEQALKDLKAERAAFVRRSIVLLIAQSSIAKEPAVRQALVEQARFERAKHTTLLNLFATVLTRDEVLEVLQ